MGDEFIEFEDVLQRVATWWYLEGRENSKDYEVEIVVRMKEEVRERKALKRRIAQHRRRYGLPRQRRKQRPRKVINAKRSAST